MKIDKDGETMKLENLKIDKLSITAFFFYEKSAKINAFLDTGDNKEPTTICLDLEQKEDVLDLLFFCPNWKKTLELNDLGFKQTKNYAESYQHRIEHPKNGDVVTLYFFPIVIENIYLDWELKKKDDGTMGATLTHFYKLPEKALKKLLRFEDKTFFIDLNDESWTCLLVNPDGSTESCENVDVNFWDLLTKGAIIGDSLPPRK